VVSRRRGKRKGERPAESYRGKTEEAREAQLANLKAPPPPTPANQFALKHGAHSAVLMRDVSAEVAELQAALGELVPFRPAGVGPPVVATEACARALKRWRSVGSWLDAHGRLDLKGAPRPAARFELELEAALWKAIEQLALSPASAAELAAKLGLAQAAFDGAGGPAGDDDGAMPEFAAIARDPATILASRDLVRAAAAARDRALGPPPPAPPEPEEEDGGS
jgi:hypothetical protein